MCLSAGITLTEAFTHLPQNTALQPAAPPASATKPYKVTPARERQKSWPGVRLPQEEQLLLFLGRSAVHCADLSLKSRSLEHPEGEATVWKTVPARMLQAGEML